MEKENVYKRLMLPIFFELYRSVKAQLNNFGRVLMPLAHIKVVMRRLHVEKKVNEI